MKRVLSSIGIGGATVDTVLPDDAFVPGATVSGTVEMTGGDSTQTVDGVYFSLKASTPDDGKRELARFTVDESVTLGPGDEASLPIDLAIPLWTPITQGAVSVWLETGLDISWARDPSDEDAIDIKPDTYTSALFEAMDALGFELESSTLVDTHIVDDRPFAQQFDFRPTDQFETVLDDIELTLIPRGDDLRVFLEFDRVDEIAEEYDLPFDETEISLTFDRANASMIQNRISSEIKQHT